MNTIQSVARRILQLIRNITGPPHSGRGYTKDTCFVHQLGGKEIFVAGRTPEADTLMFDFSRYTGGDTIYFDEQGSYFLLAVGNYGVCMPVGQYGIVHGRARLMNTMRTTFYMIGAHHQSLVTGHRLTDQYTMHDVSTRAQFKELDTYMAATMVMGVLVDLHQREAFFDGQASAIDVEAAIENIVFDILEDGVKRHLFVSSLYEDSKTVAFSREHQEEFGNTFSVLVNSPKLLTWLMLNGGINEEPTEEWLEKIQRDFAGIESSTERMVGATATT